MPKDCFVATIAFRRDLLDRRKASVENIAKLRDKSEVGPYFLKRPTALPENG